MTEAIKKAFEHVREHFPNVCKVEYIDKNTWIYSDEFGNVPHFDKSNVKMAIIENGLYSVTEFPSTYEFNK